MAAPQRKTCLLPNGTGFARFAFGPDGKAASVTLDAFEDVEGGLFRRI